MRQQGRNGFTLVEFLVVAVVVGALVGVGMHFLLQRDRARVQAAAFADPGLVFGVACSSIDEEYPVGRPVRLTAELYNRTFHDLDFAFCERGNCWLELTDESGESRFVWVEPLLDGVNWETGELPEFDMTWGTHDQQFRVALISLSGFGRGRGYIELELVHAPRGSGRRGCGWTCAGGTKA